MNEPGQKNPPNDRDLLKAFLDRRDESCPLCGYNLRGLTGSQCPECAKALVLRVGLEEPNLGAYVTGLIALASATGFCFLMFLFFVIFSAKNNSSIPRVYFFATGVGAVFSSICLVCWIRLARMIRGCSRSKRVVAAIATFLVPLICFTMFMWAAINEK
ncbi:MAG: hypothetical protein O7G85_10870 [Planctomycetota bacterium]|nr:hypothetical protein [Planctomycetota bacterium]